MPYNLDLDAIKAAMSYLSSYWDSADFRGARNLTQEGMDLIPLVLNAAPALIAEVERLRQESADFEAVCMSQEGQIARLRQQLATAKRVGAAEELERMAEPYIHEYLAGSQYLELANRPWECTQDLKNSINDCLKCELLNRAAELRAEVGE
jgi:hypothetical protein